MLAWPHGRYNASTLNQSSGPSHHTTHTPLHCVSMIVAIPQNWLCEYNSSTDGRESTMCDVNTGLCGKNTSACPCHRCPECRRARPTRSGSSSRRPPRPRYAGCSRSRHGNPPRGGRRPRAAELGRALREMASVDLPTLMILRRPAESRECDFAAQKG